MVSYEMPFLLKVIIFILIAWFLLRLVSRKLIVETHDHQHRHFENLNLSAQAFYDAVEAAVRDKGYPNLTVSRVSFPEGSIMLGNRDYLRISRFHMVFDLCAAPFGKDFFIAWWVGPTPDTLRALIAAIPVIGKSLERACYRKTMYFVDAEIMFTESVKRIIEEAILGATEGKGLRGIGERERINIPSTQPA